MSVTGVLYFKHRILDGRSMSYGMLYLSINESEALSMSYIDIGYVESVSAKRSAKFYF